MTKLELKHLKLDCGRENIVLIHKENDVVKNEGFLPLSRVKLFNDKSYCFATLNFVEDENILKKNEIGVSKKVFGILKAKEKDLFEVKALGVLSSFNAVIDKLRGISFTEESIFNVIRDIVDGKYTDMQIACLCSATAGEQLSEDEIAYFAKAMVNTGEVIKWNKDIVVDKHCIGGIPGNRTTPLVIAIIAEYGMYIPKTSSRAITSPSGTADTMEVLTNVDIPSAKMKDIVSEVNGCLLWGGGIDLSPSDDIIINVKKDIGLDSKGQMLASILSKKVAAGSTHVLIDIPYGPSAKSKDLKSAKEMKDDFENLGKKLGIHVYVDLTEGTQPVGNGVGPALEATDIVRVLQNTQDAPQDLKEKTIYLSGIIIEFDPKVKKGEGEKIARDILESGKAWERFRKICEAQGGMKEIPVAKFTYDLLAKNDGTVVEFENKKLSNLAKLAGCPNQKAAGFYLYKHLNDKVKKGEKILTIHSNSKGELELAVDYTNKEEMIKIK